MPGEWARFEIDYDLAGKKIRIRVDDDPMPTLDAPLEPPPDMADLTPSLSFGLAYFDVGGWRVAFDNVTVDVK